MGEHNTIEEIVAAFDEDDCRAFVQWVLDMRYDRVNSSYPEPPHVDEQSHPTVTFPNDFDHTQLFLTYLWGGQFCSSYVQVSWLNMWMEWGEAHG